LQWKAIFSRDGSSIHLQYLVGGLEHFLVFDILGIIIQLTNIFQRGRYTTNQVQISNCSNPMLEYRMVYSPPPLQVLFKIQKKILKMGHVEKGNP
jgi:hypothetical protein